MQTAPVDLQFRAARGKDPRYFPAARMLRHGRYARKESRIFRSVRALTPANLADGGIGNLRE
jgi:hypothetical protein